MDCDDVYLVLSSLGGYVRRQAPGTEKKTALKVEMDTNHISVNKCFLLHYPECIELMRSANVNKAASFVIYSTL